MSTQTFEVEIVDGKVTPLPPHVLPLSGRGVLTVGTESVDEVVRPVEIVDGPDGYKIFRGGRRITAALVKQIQERLDLEDALRCSSADRPVVGEP